MKVQVLSPGEVAERSARWNAARSDARAAGQRLMHNDFELAEQAGRGTALFFWHPPAEGDVYGGFSWLCPGCGSWYYGQLADQPVSGWSAPRWVNSGTHEAPTLTPSLGCGGWRRGTCPEGHYWLRDGELVRA